MEQVTNWWHSGAHAGTEDSYIHIPKPFELELFEFTDGGKVELYPGGKGNQPYYFFKIFPIVEDVLRQFKQLEEMRQKLASQNFNLPQN